MAIMLSLLSYVELLTIRSYIDFLTYWVRHVKLMCMIHLHLKLHPH